MDIITFTYTKDPSNTSERVFIPLSVPSDKYFGIDISELDLDSQISIAAEISALDAERQSRISEIMSKYDVRTNFRNFLASKMSNIIEE